MRTEGAAGGWARLEAARQAALKRMEARPLPKGSRTEPQYPVEKDEKAEKIERGSSGERPRVAARGPSGPGYAREGVPGGMIGIEKAKVVERGRFIDVVA